MTVLTTAVELAALGLGTWVTSWHAAPTKKADGSGPVGAWSASGEPSEPATVTATATTAEWRDAGALPPLETAQPSGPLLVAPPPAGEPPPFLAEGADATSRFLRGYLNGHWLLFGFYAGDIARFIDGDGARYTGATVNAVAVMREVDGERSFTLQISISIEAKLQATFLGGPHDAETLELSPLVEHPDA
jgi:hypothetical protein